MITIQSIIAVHRLFISVALFVQTPNHLTLSRLKKYKLQWNAQRIRKRRNSTHEQIKLHCTSRTHASTTHLPHLPLYPHLLHLPARISGQGREGRGQGWTSDTISATLTRLFALILFISDRIKRESASVKHRRQNQQSER